MKIVQDISPGDKLTENMWLATIFIENDASLAVSLVASIDGFLSTSTL